MHINQIDRSDDLNINLHLSQKRLGIVKRLACIVNDHSTRFLKMSNFSENLKKHKFSLISETVLDIGKRTKILGSHTSHTFGITYITAPNFESLKKTALHTYLRNG